MRFSLLLFFVYFVVTARGVDASHVVIRILAVAAWVLQRRFQLRGSMEDSCAIGKATCGHKMAKHMVAHVLLEQCWVVRVIFAGVWVCEATVSTFI